MSWSQKIIQTYDKLSAETEELTPIAHMYAKAHIEVYIGQDGTFKRAEVISKEDMVTLIPVSESSGGRSSGVAPHALNDTLPYLAHDYSQYCAKEKDKSLSKKKYDTYIKNLENWNNSQFSHKKVECIFNYLTSSNMIQDLINAGLVNVNAEGCFDDKKIGGQGYDKVLVRFRVVGGINDEDRTWKDTTLINAYTSFYLSKQGDEKDFCFLTGKNSVITENHPKNIASIFGNAKIISGNDNSGFTYRGRFVKSIQAIAISYEASQKLHGALKWLIKEQGTIIGANKDRRIFICWNPEGKETIDLADSIFLLDEADNSFLDDQRQYKMALHNWIDGKKANYEESDSIIVMAFDAATTGRLSITYYQELAASDFWHNIEYWLESLFWYFRGKNILKTPSIGELAKVVCGTERGKYIEADEKLWKSTVERLIKCMIERRSIPKDLIFQLYEKASKPYSYKEEFNKELILSMACAAIQKNKIDLGQMEKEKTMKLDTKCQNRDYLYGRLLAIYDRVEKIAMNQNENRETNALRYQFAFVNHPYQTWKILEEMTMPSFQRLKPGSREYYRKMISELVLLFKEEDKNIMNQSLKEDYLLGYYLQRMEFSKKYEKEENDNE